MLGAMNTSVNMRCAGYDEFTNGVSGNVNQAVAWQQTDCCVYYSETGTSPTLRLRAIKVSLDVDGFTLNFTTTTTGHYLQYIAFGGTDLTNSHIGSFLTSALIGAQAFTGIGFQPDLNLFFSTVYQTTDPIQITTGNAQSIMGLARSTGGIEQRSSCASSDFAVATSTELLRQQSTFAYLNSRSAGYQRAGSLTSHDADGFTLNWAQANTAHTFYGVSLRGLRTKLLTFTQRTSVGSQAITGAGFTPKGVIFLSGGLIASTASQAGHCQVNGFAESGGTQFCYYNWGQNGMACTSGTALRCHTGRRTTEVIHFENESVGTLAVASLLSFDADGFTLNWTTVADTTAREIYALVIGEQSVVTTINPTGIANVETFGTALVSLNISPTGIADITVLGTPTVSIGAVSIYPTGIADTTAFGVPVISFGAVTISPSAIISGETFGSLSVSLNVSPSGIADLTAFGTIQVNLNASLTGISSGEVFGTVTINRIVLPTGISSGEVFGTATISVGTITLTPTGIVTSENFGTVVVSIAFQPQTISPTGIANVETFGTVQVNLSLTANGIATSEALGTVIVVTGALPAFPIGITSGEVFGTPSISTTTIIINPTSILSAEAFGVIQVSLDINVTGIASIEIFGVPTITGGAISISPTGILTSEAFGTPTIGLGGLIITPTGIATSEVLGTARINYFVNPQGLISGEIFGTVNVVGGSVTISINGIVTGIAFGTVFVVAGQLPEAHGGVTRKRLQYGHGTTERPRTIKARSRSEV